MAKVAVLVDLSFFPKRYNRVRRKPGSAPHSAETVAKYVWDTAISGTLVQSNGNTSGAVAKLGGCEAVIEDCETKDACPAPDGWVVAPHASVVAIVAHESPLSLR